jgi:hypothetical protein
MKNIFYGVLVALTFVACGGAASREKNNDGTYWLMQDGRAQYCIQELRYRAIIPMGMPVSLYPDYVNIVEVRQQNPGTYSLTEMEFKGLCRSIGIDLSAPVQESEPR